MTKSAILSMKMLGIGSPMGKVVAVDSEAKEFKYGGAGVGKVKSGSEDKYEKSYVATDQHKNGDGTIVKVTVDTRTNKPREITTLLIVGTMNGKAVISSGINTPEAFGTKPFGRPYHPIETIVESDYKPPTMRSNIKKGKRR